MENTISFTFSEDNDATSELLKMIDEENWGELLHAVLQHWTQSTIDNRANWASWVNWAEAAVYARNIATELQPEIEKLTCSIECTTKYWNSYRETIKDWKVQLRAMKKKQRDALNTYRICKQRFANAKKQAERLTKNAAVAHDKQNNGVEAIERRKRANGMGF